MLVTFRCKAYADITMFGDVAVQLLKMMGHSGTVPGALMPEDIPAALERLKSSLQRMEPVPTQGDEDEPPVSMSHRAMPLLSLLEAALKENTPVMWDK
ncbi:MAG: DUF1840 domain-containing protein [Candidatus Thiodiazotropha sp.]